jgi:hypothetical protein
MLDVQCWTLNVAAGPVYGRLIAPKPLARLKEILTFLGNL